MFIPEVCEALADIAVGDELIVVTWLDRARRDVLRTHPQNDRTKPLCGVFSTRSPHRPNPIGLHRVRVSGIADGLAIAVESLEAFDGTPILDVKAVYGGTADA